MDNKQSGYSVNIRKTGWIPGPGLAYVPGSNALYRIHPLCKLVLLLSFSITVLLLDGYLPGFILLVMLLITYQAAGLGMSFFWRKLKLILIFGTMILFVQALFCREGKLLWYYSIPGKINLEIWSGGLLSGLGMALRFINVIGSSYLFVAITNPNELAFALMQAGLPYRYGFMLVTSLRFIPLFQLELNNVRNAQLAKGIDLEGLSPRNFLRAVRYLLLPLVISALSKVDSLAISMEGRAFGLYPTRTYQVDRKLTRRNWFLLLTTPVLFIIFYFLCQRFA